MNTSSHNNAPVHSNPLLVVKIGGNVIDDENKLQDFLQRFSKLPGLKILVHGGGKLATRVAEAMHIPQTMVDGRRITDAETLKVVTMVYAGYINKNIVAQLQFFGTNALGLSGADGNLIKAHKRIHPQIDYGFAGDVDEVNTGLIAALLSQGITLVVPAITHDGQGLLLNTNADTIAQELAKAMSKKYAVSLLYSFEKSGVLQDSEDDTSVLPVITASSFARYRDEGIVAGGMIPKLQNAFAALDAGVQRVIIGHADDLELLLENKKGTTILHD